MSATPITIPQSPTFPPLAPKTAVPPTKIADDTWVIHQVQEALWAAACTCTSTRW